MPRIRRIEYNLIRYAERDSPSMFIPGHTEVRIEVELGDYQKFQITEQLEDNDFECRLDYFFRHALEMIKEHGKTKLPKDGAGGDLRDRHAGKGRGG